MGWSNNKIKYCGSFVNQYIDSVNKTAFVLHEKKERKILHYIIIAITNTKSPLSQQEHTTRQNINICNLTL